MPALITNAVFLEYHDFRWVGKNMLDTEPGTSATYAQLIDTNSVAGARLERLISAASEMLLAAACGQARYSLEDIQTHGGHLRDMIVANLTVGPVLTRRDRPSEDEDALSLSYKQAVNYLELLQKGERIFYAVPDVPEAGLPGTASMAPRLGIDPPLLTQCATRYFGTGRPNSYGCGGGNCGG